MTFKIDFIKKYLIIKIQLSRIKMDYFELNDLYGFKIRPD